MKQIVYMFGLEFLLNGEHYALKINFWILYDFFMIRVTFQALPRECRRDPPLLLSFCILVREVMFLCLSVSNIYSKSYEWMSSPEL